MPLKPATKIIATAMPAVVSITITKHIEDVEKDIPHDLASFFNPESKQQRDFLRKMTDANGMVQVGGGSGFIVDEGGIVVTNRHVIADPKAEYSIITTDDQKFIGEVMARDPVNDVAILRLHLDPSSKKKVKKLPTLKLGDASRVELGEPILAIGNSLGMFRNTVSAGIISGLSRAIRAQVDPSSPTQEMRGLIQTDAAINPGNSGGPLLNAAGLVIGINTAIVFGAQNIGFAIPINAVKKDLSDLKIHGRIRRPLLGVRYLTIDDNLAHKLNLPVDNGALIVSEENTPGIIPNSPASKSGLKEKDIITHCDNKPLTDKYTIQDILENKNADDTIQLTILRGSQERTIPIKLTERK